MFTVVGGKVEKKEIPATIMIFLFSRKEIELSQKGSLEVEKREVCRSSRSTILKRNLPPLKINTLNQI